MTRLCEPKEASYILIKKYLEQHFPQLNVDSRSGAKNLPCHVLTHNTTLYPYRAPHAYTKPDVPDICLGVSQARRAEELPAEVCGKGISGADHRERCLGDLPGSYAHLNGQDSAAVHDMGVHGIR